MISLRLSCNFEKVFIRYILSSLLNKLLTQVVVINVLSDTDPLLTMYKINIIIIIIIVVLCRRVDRNDDDVSIA